MDYLEIFPRPDFCKSVHDTQCQPADPSKVLDQTGDPGCASFPPPGPPGSMPFNCVALGTMGWGVDPFLTKGFGASQRFLGDCWAIGAIFNIIEKLAGRWGEKEVDLPLDVCMGKGPGTQNERPGSNCFAMSADGQYTIRLWNPSLNGGKGDWADFTTNDIVPAITAAGGCANNYQPIISTHFGLELISKALVNTPELMGKAAGGKTGYDSQNGNLLEYFPMLLLGCKKG